MKYLILIDDHKMLRKGICAFFTENSDWHILAEAESLEEIPTILSKVKEEASNAEDVVVAVVDIQLKFIVAF